MNNAKLPYALWLDRPVAATKFARGVLRFAPTAECLCIVNASLTQRTQELFENNEDSSLDGLF